MEVVNGMLRRDDRSHFRLNGEPKVKYSTERDAVIRCYEMNMQDSQTYKMVMYKCPVCNKWHIGNSRNPLRPEDKDKIRKKYKEIKIKLGTFWN